MDYNRNFFFEIFFLPTKVCSIKQIGYAYHREFFFLSQIIFFYLKIYLELLVVYTKSSSEESRIGATNLLLTPFFFFGSGFLRKKNGEWAPKVNH